MQPGPAVPAAPPGKTGPRLAAGTTRAGRVRLDHPVRPQLHHRPDRARRLITGSRNQGRPPSAWPTKPSGEMGARPGQRAAIDLDVELLVVEGDHPGDGLQLAGR